MANYGSGWEELGRVILLRGRVIMVLDTGQVPTVAHHLLLVIYRKYLSFLMYINACLYMFHIIQIVVTVHELDVIFAYDHLTIDLK